MNGTHSSLASSWQTFWSGLTGNSGIFFNVLGVVAAVLIVGVLVMWLFKKARGRSEGFGSLGIWLIVCAFLAAPGIIIPAVLRIVDAIINMLAGGAGTIQ